MDENNPLMKFTHTLGTQSTKIARGRDLGA